MMFRIKLIGLMIAVFGLSHMALAEETHTVKARGMAFEPMVIQIEPGDTVVWRNMSTHNTESLEGMIPEGAEPWKSPLSENYRHTFEEEGVYIYVCTPHVSMGMGGAVVVGNPNNLEDVKAVEVSGGRQRIADEAIKVIEEM